MGDAGMIQQVNVMTAGVAAGFTGTVLGHPLDLIKVRLQARSEYKGTVDCFKKTFKNDGVVGMFRGMTSPLFVSIALNSLTFGSYIKLNKVQESLLTRFAKDSSQSQQLTFYNHFISGGAVGMLCSTFSCPFEVIKVRMQLDDKVSSMAKNSGISLATSSNMPQSATTLGLHQRKYTGFFDCGMQTWRQAGFRGFFAGYIPTTIRDVAFCATYFSVYEMFKKSLQSHPLFITEAGGFSPVPIILSGGVSGALAWMVSFPFDVVKTAMQDNNKPHNTGLNKTSSSPLIKQSMLGVAKSHYSKVGISGFYSGLVPAVCRAFLVSSVRFFTYESVLYLLDKSTQKMR